MTQEYSVAALGGLREIGKNMWLVFRGDDFLMIDAGLKFPDDDMYGVNYLLPNYDYVLEHQQHLKGIVLTHAHEDHVGCLTYLLEELDDCPPIYASELTLGLLEERITKIDKQYKDQLQSIKGRSRLHIGPFDVEFVHVCHSISGALGLAVHTDTDQGAIVFTGDFKMDPTPIDQQPTDYYKFAQLGEEGVLLLVSDSTNATTPGHTVSEHDVAENFRLAFLQAKGRLIVATFASSLHRIQQIVNRCIEFDRRIAFVGHSMKRNTEIAHTMGYLKYPPGTLIDADEIKNFPDEKVAILTTGAQGEPMAALSRMAKGRHHHVEIQSGDTIIISATPIPGNEKSIYENINRLVERGAHVMYESRRGLHASGHASQEELKLMLNLTKPKYFIPTHGEYRQMEAHGRLAKATGMEAKDIFLLDNGQRLHLGEEKAEVTEKLPAGYSMISGRGSGYLEKKELKERHRLVKQGVVMVSVTFDELGAPALQPRLTSRGFPLEDQMPNFHEEVAEKLRQALQKQWDKWYKHDREVNLEQCESWVSDHLSRILYQESQRRPVIVPLVNQLGAAKMNKALFQDLLQKYQSGQLNPDNIRLQASVAPPKASEIKDMAQLGHGEYNQLKQMGREAVAQGEVAAVVLAGGMATRFQYPEAKALFPILEDTTFLELKVRTFCGAGIPLYLMTSFHTHEPILKFLTEHNHFGYAELIHVFQQFKLPRISPEGVIRKIDGQLDCATSGHGDFPFAFRESQLLQKFIKNDGKYLLFSNIDNLGATFEPAILGQHIAGKKQMTIEVADKDVGDKGGAPAEVNGRLQLVEGFLFPESFDQDSIDVFNTASYIFSAEALLQEFELPWYVVKKEVNGDEVLQFERLAGDLSRDLSIQCLRVERDERFLPVKTQSDAEKIAPFVRKQYGHLFN